MPVRVRIRVEPLVGSRAGAPFESVALVNTGYTPEAIEGSLPEEAARAWGLGDPGQPGRETVRIRTYGGDVDVIRLRGSVRVRVVTPDREGPVATADVVVTDTDDEALLGDGLTEALGIEPIRPRTGLWRFMDDPHDRLRPSEPPQYW